MKLSKETNLAMAYIIERWTAAEVDRLLIYLNIAIPKDSNGVDLSKSKKANLILSQINDNEDIQLKVINYIIDDFSSKHENVAEPDPFSLGDEKSFDELFCEKYPTLTNSLKRDGFTLKNKEITPLLPDELVNANVENELFRLLDKYQFTTTKGHLEQAIENHSNGNWAGANSQFRTFLESLLVDICNKLIPSKNCTSYGEALQWLATPSMITPVFLSPTLNEVPIPGAIKDKTYISGLMKRLHPQGSHPGLSDEEDSTFRYHTLIVFARYVLKRLEDRA